MFGIGLIVIAVWSVFWLGYTIYIYNEEKIFLRPKRSISKAERPVLFHAEIVISAGFAVFGYVMMFLYLLGFA